ncbi:hypothetical protein D3C87_2080030 [compost metagenome]
MAVILLLQVAVLLVLEVALVDLARGEDPVDQVVLLETFEDAVDAHRVHLFACRIQEILDFVRRKRRLGL